MENKRQAMPVENAKSRIRNFSEVAKGFTLEQAKNEADRCLNCKSKPCVKSCPVAVDIPAFIEKIKSENIEDAYKIISKSSLLPAICGRVCPQERQCEGSCIRGLRGEAVAIGALERFVADFIAGTETESNCKNETFKIKGKSHKVAVIGSGPAGLSCAGELVKEGYEVTVYEALQVLGGVLVYGIPEFRLPKKIVDHEISKLKQLGVNFETNVVIGKTLSVEELFDMGFEAVFIGSGAGLPKFIGIEGENLNGIYSANEFLTRVNLMNAYKNETDTPIGKLGKVAVIGGGNVAMDAARVAKRLTEDDVFIIYRRSEKELPARLEEVEHAKEEGIIFKFLSNPKRFFSGEDFRVKKIECADMELLAEDSSGRRKVQEKQNSRFHLDVDTVIMAIGTSPNPIIASSCKALKLNDRGGILVDDQTLMTSIDGVFAGGDAVSGAATVILAMGAGKMAAKAISSYIESKNS